MALELPNTGKLRDRISFQRRVTADDGGGGQVANWQPLCGPMFARIRPINGREDVLDAKLSGVQPFEISVRMNATTTIVTVADRAVNEKTGVTYDITAIQNPDERGMWLSMLVKAGKPSDG